MNTGFYINISIYARNIKDSIQIGTGVEEIIQNSTAVIDAIDFNKVINGMKEIADQKLFSYELAAEEAAQKAEAEAN